MPQIIPTAEPFFCPGNSTGVLLVHGFTGAPKEMRWMGEYLNREHGYTCLGIRLAGHATRPEDMVRSRYTDWTVSVEDGCHLLRGVSQRIFIAGLSMGGVLSLLMSTRLDVTGVIAMSTPYEFPLNYPNWIIRAASYFKHYMKKSEENDESTWFDHDAMREHVSYPFNPVRSGAELQLLIHEMQVSLPKINVPVLLMHSQDDTYVTPASMERIHARLGTSDKEMLWLTGSGHVVTRDAARGQVFAAAAAFIRRLAG